MNIINAFDFIIYIYFGLSVLYLFIFAFFSLFSRDDHYPETSRYHHILVLFPAYREDEVIESSLRSFLNQHYPKSHYKVVVVSDQMSEETDNKIGSLGVQVLTAGFINSSKAKALNHAMDCLKDSQSEIIVILDADNTVEPDFLDQINRAYHAGAMAIQAHRRAKNLNTDIAVLDAASEEMNNSYFRKGHVFIGLSSALSGSGMAFDYKWFLENIRKVTSSGEDKELEILLLRQKIYIEYLDNIPVYDEKVQNTSDFSRQRLRWMAAQLGSLKMAARDFPYAIRSRNIDYIDKLIQWTMVPRLLLLGFITLFSIVIPFIKLTLAFKWWVLLFALLITFGMAIPKRLDNKLLEKAVIKIPKLFFLMFINLFRLKGINKKFLHTVHRHS